MRVEFGINPNCSELIMRLDGWGFEEAKEELAAHGFEEAWIKDMYDLERNKQQEWDNINEEKIIYTKDLPPTTLALMRKANLNDQEVANKAKEKLKKLGYTDNWYDFDLVHKDTPPDYENGSTISLLNDFDGNETVVRAHQHCQTQLYPLLYKISKIFHCDVEGYDGGSNQTYEDWINAGRPNVKTWNPEE